MGLRECRDRGDLHVLVDGLGFGFTLRALLRDSQVARAVAVELEPMLVSFVERSDVRAELPVRDLADPRVLVRAGNVRDAIVSASGTISSSSTSTTARSRSRRSGTTTSTARRSPSA